MTASYVETAESVPSRSRGPGVGFRAWAVAAIIIIVIVWEACVRFFDIPRFLLPTPSEIVRLVVDEWALVQMHSLSTIWSIATGYIAATIFAMAASALMIRFRWPRS